MCKTNRSGKSACLTRSQIEEFCSNLPIKYSILAELMYYSAGRVREITTILQQLANTHEGKAQWQGLLNKSTLLHEVEESILAIHFLQEAWKQQQQQEDSGKDVVLVDVCCGKGVFSLLASN